MAYKNNKQWTIEEFRTIKELWLSKTFSELVDILGVTKNQLSYVTEAMRKEGIDLPKKRLNGQIRNLIREYKKTI